MNIRFRLRPVQLLVALACVVVAITIGNLQHNRAEQKQAAFDRIDGARYNAPIQVGSSPVDASLLDWHPAVARGRRLDDKSILVDNRVHGGVAGYHVITPADRCHSSDCGRALFSGAQET